MFRLNKSSSGVPKNHKTNYNIVISFMVLRYTSRWLVKSKHVTLT